MVRKSCFAAIVFFLLTGLTFGQTGRRGGRRGYSIRGRVLLSTGRDIDQRIEVRLERSGMQPVATTYTDAIGNFEFRNLAAGTYHIVIHVEGFKDVNQSVSLYSSADAFATTSIFLAPKDSGYAKKTGLDAADPNIIDVSQLSLPKKAVQNYEKGVEENKKGRPEKAMKLFEEAIKIAPNFFRAHTELGLLYQKAGRYRDGEREYRLAHELVPRNAEPLINLGSLYVQESEFRKEEGRATVGKLLDHALDALEEAVKLDPHSAIAYYYLGMANLQSSFLEEAEAALKTAWALDPKIGITRIMLANVYVRQNKWEEALANVDAYLEENPEAEDRVSIQEWRAKIAKGAEASTQ